MECIGSMQKRHMQAPASGRGKLTHAPTRGEGKIEVVPLVPPYIESLRPYEAGRTIESVREKHGLSRVAKLASNENPLGASPKAIEAMTRVLDRLNLYPNGGLDLRAELARQYDGQMEQVGGRTRTAAILMNNLRPRLCHAEEVTSTGGLLR